MIEISPTVALLIFAALLTVVILAIYFRGNYEELSYLHKQRRNEIKAKALALRFLASGITGSDVYVAKQYNNLMHEAEVVLPCNAWATDLETVTVWHPFRELTVLDYIEIVEELKNEILNVLSGETK